MRYDQVSPVPPLTNVTKILIIICSVSYVTDFVLSTLGFQVGGLTLNEIFGLVPSQVMERGWLWQFLTYIFMHGSPLHLLLNMLILWYFGAEMELKFGEREFLKYFLLCGIGAGVFNFLVNMAFSSNAALTQPIIGASGAIYGILAAYGIFFGDRYFLVFFLFPMKAKYFVLLMAAIELITGVEASAQDHVAHFAHIGGMFVGAAYLYFKYLRGGGSGKTSKRDAERERLRRQFTLIVNQKPDDGTDPKGPKGPKDSKDGGPYWN